MSLHLKINCGNFSNLYGWSGDSGFSGGSTFTFYFYPDIDISKISNPAPLKIYDTVRFTNGTLQYSFSGLNSQKSYRIILHWIETNSLRRVRVFVNSLEISPGGVSGMSILELAGYKTAFTLAHVISGVSVANIEIVEVSVNAFISAIEIIEIQPPSLDIPFNVLGLIPEHYFENVSDFEEVTASAKYQDGGKIFNLNNSIAPREWKFVFSGLSEKEAAVFDEHFLLAEGSLGQKKDFPFTDRKNYTYDSGIYYKNYEKSHEKNKRWIQQRNITLIQYP